MTKISKSRDPYCAVCGTCGITACCGIKDFLDKHVKGKTNCLNEDWIIKDILDTFEYFNRNE